MENRFIDIQFYSSELNITVKDNLKKNMEVSNQIQYQILTH